MVRKKVWRLPADASDHRLASRGTSEERSAQELEFLPRIMREDIVREMMKIFNGLLGGTPKRSGLHLGLLHGDQSKQQIASQRKFEMAIYRLIKGLVEQKSPDTGFAIEILFNNGSYFYNKANVPPSFGVFIKSMVDFLEGHDYHASCPEEMNKLRTLLGRA